MIRYLMAGALILALNGSVALAQSTPPAPPERWLASPDSALRFVVPADWHVLREGADKSAARYVYHVRNPATDSGADRTNVIVQLYKRDVPGDFRAFTDSAMARMRGGSELILDDHLVNADRRALFWRGQMDSTPYMGFDNFARVNGYWLHIRIVSPLSERTTEAWSAAFSRDTERLLATLTLRGALVMNDHTGFPVLTTFPARTPPARPVGESDPEGPA